jgi:hypothetical protein
MPSVPNNCRVCCVINYEIESEIRSTEDDKRELLAPPHCPSKRSARELKPIEDDLKQRVIPSRARDLGFRLRRHDL